MTREVAYDRAKALVAKMYAVNADAEATEAAIVSVADAIYDASLERPPFAIEVAGDGQRVRIEAPTIEELLRLEREWK